MPNNRLYIGNSSRRMVFVFAFCMLLVLGYGLFEARRLLEGPQIAIHSPIDGTATSTSALVVEGTAHNVSFLTLNDMPAFTDESGYFRVTFSPPPGYTVVTLAAVDRFGRRASESISVTVFNYCHV